MKNYTFPGLDAIICDRPKVQSEVIELYLLSAGFRCGRFPAVGGGWIYINDTDRRLLPVEIRTTRAMNPNPPKRLFRPDAEFFVFRFEQVFQDWIQLHDILEFEDGSFSVYDLATALISEHPNPATI